MGLNKRQQVFVEHYLVCWNASEAARRAGYTGQANVVGPRLLANVSISEVIRARLQELHMSADEVLARLSEQGRGDIGEFLELSPSNMRHHPRSHLLKKVKRTVTTIHAGPDIVETTETYELEMYDAQSALTQMGRHHKLFTDRVETVDWRSEMEAAGLNPDAEREKLTREYEAALAGGAGSDAVGGLGGGESKA